MQPGQGQPPQGQPQGQPPQGYGQQPQGYGQPPQQPAAPAGPPNPAQTAGIIMLVCGALLAVGLFTKSWGTVDARRMEVNLGVIGAEACRRGECRSASRLYEKVDADIKIMRWLGLLSGLAALAAMCAAGGMALARNTAKIPIKPMQIVLGVASGSLTYFAFRLGMEKGVDPGYSAFLGVGAIIGAGVVHKQMLQPLIERALAGDPTLQPLAAGAAAAGGMQAGMPMQQQPMQGQPMQQQPMQGQPMQQQAAAPAQPQAPAAQAGAAPNCGTCGAATQYVAQYQRYFCTACQQYV